MSPKQMFDNMRKSYHCQNQKPSSQYLLRRSDLIKNMRLICNKLNFCSESFYLSVYYLDSILYNYPSDLKINTVKFIENYTIVPNLVDFERAYNKLEFTIDEIKKYEVISIKALGYKLIYFTAYHFINYFILHGYIFSDELMNPNLKIKEKHMYTNNHDLYTKISDKIYNNAKDILFCFVDENYFLNFSPLQISCSCVAISRDIIKLQDAWSPNLEKIYEIKIEDFRQCMNTILNSITKKVSNNSELSIYFTNKRISSGEKNYIHKSTTISFNPINKNNLISEELKKNIEKKEENDEFHEKLNSPSIKNNKKINSYSKMISPFKKEPIMKKLSENSNSLEKSKLNSYNNILGFSKNIEKPGVINQFNLNEPNQEIKNDNSISENQSDISNRNVKIIKTRPLNINLALKPNNHIVDNSDNEDESMPKIQVGRKNKYSNIYEDVTNGFNYSNINKEIKNIKHQQTKFKDVLLPEDSNHIKDLAIKYYSNLNLSIKSNNELENQPKLIKEKKFIERKSDKKYSKFKTMIESTVSNNLGEIIKNLIEK